VLIKYHSTFTVFQFLPSIIPAFLKRDIDIFLYGVLRFCVLKVNTKLSCSAPGWCVGNGGSASFFLNLDSRWRRVASFRPRPVPFSRWVGGPQNRSGHCAENTHALTLPTIEAWNLDYSVRYLDGLWWNLTKCRKRLSSKVIRRIHFTDCFRILIIKKKNPASTNVKFNNSEHKIMRSPRTWTQKCPELSYD